MTSGELDVENGKFSSGDSSCDIPGGGSVQVIGGGKIVECSGLGTNRIALGSAITNDSEVKCVHEEVMNTTKGSTVNHLKINGVSKECLKGEIKIQFGSFGLNEEDSNHKLQENRVSDKATHEEVNRDIEAEVRFDDEKLKEQIEIAQLHLDEKRRCRREIRAEIQKKKEILEGYDEALKAAKLEVIAADKLVKSKRPESESIQRLIKKTKIDEETFNKTYNRELMMKTKEQRYEIQKRLNILEKEVKCLKDNEVKAKVAALAIRKICEEEMEIGLELYARFQAANEACQQACENLNSLKKRLHNKNKISNVYKQDGTPVQKFASSGDKVAHHHLCANQTQVDQRKKTISSLGNQTKEEQEKKTVSREPFKFLVRDSKFVSLNEIMEGEEKEKTVVEVDKNEEEFDEKEIECNLNEQIRLKENKRMNKAIAKKKQNAEKAKKRADLRAQQEAEQKENAREKRLRKWERKKTHGDNRMNDERIVKANETEKELTLILTTGDRKQCRQWWEMITAAVVRPLYSLQTILSICGILIFLFFL